jgi:hypothetical protein
VDKSGRALVPLPREAGGAGLTPAEAVRRATVLALGAAGLALDIVRAVVERSGPAGPKAVAARTSPAPGPLLRLPGAALGLGLEAQRRSLLATSALGARLSPRLRAVARPAAAVDVGELIRESTGTMATETVDALRVQGMHADRVLGRVVDHLLRRHAARETEPVRLLDWHERSTARDTTQTTR